MKVITSVLFSLLISNAVGRVLPKEDDDEGDPLPQTSRVTAFVVDANGNPSVECWEFNNMVNSMSIRRNDGSVGRAHKMTIAANRELEGLDILTWPAASPIWPDPSTIGDDDMRPNWLDLSDTFNLFTIQTGLVNFRFTGVETAQRELPEHTFSLENGDDWFYFEDSYTNSEQAQRVDAADPPFMISSVSATETEVLRLRFPARPKYKVLHKGGCSFTGISTPADTGSKRKSHAHSPSMKQYPMAEL